MGFHTRPLEWVPTLGTELEHAMVRLAYREGLLPADRMGTWDQLPPGIPPIPETLRVAPLLFSWNDIEKLEHISTLWQQPRHFPIARN